MAKKKKNTNTFTAEDFLAAANKVEFLYEAFGEPSVFDLDHREVNEGQTFTACVTCGRLNLSLKIRREYNSTEQDPNTWHEEQFTQTRYMDRGGLIPAYRTVRYNDGRTKQVGDVADARMALGLHSDLQEAPTNDILAEILEDRLTKYEAQIFGGNFGQNHDVCSTLSVAAGHAVDRDRGTVPEAWLTTEHAQVQLPAVGTFEACTVTIRTGDDEQTDEQRDEAENTFAEFIMAVYRDMSTGYEDLDELALEHHWKKLRDEDAEFAVPFETGNCQYECNIHKAVVADLYEFNPAKIDFIWVPSEDQREALKKIEDRELRDATQIKWANDQMLIWQAWSNSRIYDPRWEIKEYATLDFDGDVINSDESDTGHVSFWDLDENQRESREREAADYKSDVLDNLAQVLELLLTEPKHGNVMKDLVQVVRRKDGKTIIQLEEPPADRTNDWELGEFVCQAPLGTKLEI